MKKHTRFTKQVILLQCQQHNNNRDDGQSVTDERCIIKNAAAGLITPSYMTCN